MPSKSKQLIQEIRDLRMSRIGSYGNAPEPTDKIRKLHKQLYDQMRIDAQEAAGLLTAMSDIKKQVAEKKAQKVNFEKLNYHREKLQAAIRNARFITDLAPLWEEAKAGDREVLQAWKDFAPAAFKDKGWERQRLAGDIQFYEIPPDDIDVFLAEKEAEVTNHAHIVRATAHEAAGILARTEYEREYDVLMDQWLEAGTTRDGRGYATAKQEVREFDAEAARNHVEKRDQLLELHAQERAKVDEAVSLRMPPSELSQRAARLHEIESALKGAGIELPAEPAEAT